MNTSFSVEKAIENFDRMISLNENDIIGYYCSKYSREGVLLITNIRFSFVLIDKEEKIKYEHILYSMINRITLDISNNESKLNIVYAYTKTVFIIPFKTEALKIKEQLVKHLGQKLEINYLNDEPVSKITSILELPTFDIGTGQLKPKETTQLNLVEEINLNYKNILTTKSLKKLSINFFLLLGLVYGFLYLIENTKSFEVLKSKGLYLTSYGINFIKIQQCESEMILFASKLKEYNDKNQEYPLNIPDFLNKNFESKTNRLASMDPWKNYYKFEILKNGLKISSAGPDKKPGTYDDIKKEFIKKHEQGI